MYDKENIFAKILQGTASSNKIHEDDFAFSFYDIYPRTRVHALVIPKGEYIDFSDFTKNASADFQANFWGAVKDTANKLGLKDFQLITNNGADAGQVVFHFHVHIMAD